VFEQQFAQGQQLGASVSVYHRGRLAVDLWGGIADEATGRPWEAGTMAVCYSTTKGLTATCLHLLADRGLVSYDDRVMKYWPGFAANGKSAITVYHLLTHQAGIPQVPEGLTSDDLSDWPTVIKAIERLEPLWEPGTDTGYHALTFGWLVGEVVRRIDGRSVGTFLRDEIARPLGLDDLHIGAPQEAEPRIARLKSPPLAPELKQVMEQMMPPGSIGARALSPADAERFGEWIDTRAGHAAEVPAANGIMTARDLARLYACFAGYGELDGVRLLSEARVRTMSALQTQRPDRVIILPVGWALGYMTGGLAGWPQGPRTTAFGHAGLGGSVGFADPEIGMGFGFVPNLMSADLVGYGRTAALAEAARTCCERAG
jgi:CubicO group peptidase (beta-lactamase class C family)